MFLIINLKSLDICVLVHMTPAVQSKSKGDNGHPHLVPLVNVNKIEDVLIVITTVLGVSSNNLIHEIRAHIESL